MVNGLHVAKLTWKQEFHDAKFSEIDGIHCQLISFTPVYMKKYEHLCQYETLRFPPHALTPTLKTVFTSFSSINLLINNFNFNQSRRSDIAKWSIIAFLSFKIQAVRYCVILKLNILFIIFAIVWKFINFRIELKLKVRQCLGISITVFSALKQLVCRIWWQFKQYCHQSSFDDDPN